jgi:hypothetical protein
MDLKVDGDVSRGIAGSGYQFLKACGSFLDRSGGPHHLLLDQVSEITVCIQSTSFSTLRHDAVDSLR